MATHIYETLRIEEQKRTGLPVHTTLLAEKLHVIQNWKHCTCKRCCDEYRRQNEKERRAKQERSRRQREKILQLKQQHQQAVNELSSVFNTKTPAERKQLLNIIKNIYGL